jgi:integrase
MSASLIREILAACDQEDSMQRYQDPPIEVRTDVKRPFYFIRPRVPYWNKQGKYDRRRTVIQLGLVSQTTMRQAKMLKEQHMAEINGRRTIALAQIPFAGLLDKYVAVGLPAVGTTTQAKYRSHIAAHIRPAFATMRMCDIDKLCITGWLQQKQHLTHEMLMSILKTLSAIFSWAEEMNMFEGVNPCRNVKVLGKKSERSKSLPDSTGLQRFLAAIADTVIISAEGARLIVLIAVASGLRVSEVLGLQLRDIDPIAETVRIERRWARGNIGPTKTKDSQRVRQIPGLAAALLAYKACGEHARNGDDYIFSGGVRGLPPDDRDLQQYVFRPAAERAGIYTPGFGMHRFRHVNISWRQEVGAHPVEAQKCAGHASLSTTWRYTQVDVERERGHVRAILERLNGHGLGTDSAEVLQ